jgi:uncharacterized membrane protein YuzA (DUF378 family)
MSTTTSYTGSSDHTPHAGFTPNVLDYIALVLTIVGGINWGLVGAFDFDLVARIFGDMTTATRAVYILVGLAALYCLTFLGRFPRKTS